MNCIEIESRLGPALLAENPDGLAGLWFVGQRHFPAASVDWPRRASPLLQAGAEQLAEYLSGRRRQFELPLAAEGSAFARSVWQQLLAIPFGQTSTYGELATAMGRTGAARAVGLAVGRNPLSIIVPCHRVVGSDGRLTGYAGGLERKAWLLDLERDTAG